jgi:hypothetical protein
MNDFINFFIQSDPLFGNVSWATGVFWLALLATGVYLLKQWRESNPARYRFGRHFGIVTTALSALGLIFLILNWFQVAPFDIRLWIYLIGFATLGYLGFAGYVYTSKLPAQIAATRSIRPVRGSAPRGARAYSANVPPAEARPARQPRPLATTTRREARREKKRKGR